MGRVMSVTSMPTLLGPILGPTIGGAILQGASWRWIFYVNVPIGIVSFLLAIRILPKQGRQHGIGARLDVPGLLLLGAGMPALTYGLAEVGNTGTFAATEVIVPLLVGLALIGGFVVHSSHAERPLLDLRLYRRSTYSFASIVTFFVGAAVFGTLILMPLYYQQLRHLNTIDTGLLLGPQGLGMVVVTPLAARLTERFGGGPVVVMGVSITMVATIPFGLIGAHTSYAWLASALFVRGIGMGFSFLPSFVAAFAALDRSELSDATPQLNMVMRVGASIGIAVLTVVLSRSLIAHAHAGTSAAGAFGTAFWWALGLTAASLVAGLGLMRAEGRARAARAHEATEVSLASELVKEAAA
jgi:EmrB/QacA subfamily drug resistance transporter